VIDLGRVGALERPDGEGRAGGGACDDRVRITLGLAGDRIARVRFAADACPTTVSACAALAALAEGCTLLEAARLGAADVPDTGRRRCVDVAVDAFHAALGDAFARGARSAGVAAAVAMSGGVDSAVALHAAHAVHRGRVVGVTLRLWIDPDAPDAERACCAPSAVRRARDACHAIGVPHVALDLRDAFHAAVVAPFVDAYAAGATPNPCVGCNGAFRLDALVRFADAVGAGRVVTGHYARIAERDGVSLVARGVDAGKDQSYMLGRVGPALAARLAFPLGEQTKDVTRARAAALGLEAARVPESQEVCFLGGGDYRTFLARRGVPFAAGPVEDEDGAVVGTHGGAAGFTPGQRRGLRVAGAEARYVLRTEPARNAVVVAPRGRLATRLVPLVDAVLHVERSLVAAKLRYRSPAVGARVEGAGAVRTLHLAEPVEAVAPGQTAVLYDGDCVVGAGTITR
jgi:tRNA-specific 2-thiouridylase